MGSTCIIMSKYSNPCTPQALEKIAMDYEHKFNVPECAFHEVYPNIIIGGESSALDESLLRRLKVTHIVNCAQGERYGHVNSDEFYYHGTDIKFYAIKATDELGFDIGQFLEPTANYIDQSLKEGGRIFVHCCMGYSRAPTIVISYLMLCQGMDSREALALVRSKRVVCPNQTFRKSLCQLNEKLRKSQLLKGYTNHPCTRQELHYILMDYEYRFDVPDRSHHEVYPNIIIGGKSTALNKDLLKYLGVTHVVNCAKGYSCGYINTDEKYYQDVNIAFYGIPASDKEGFNIMPFLHPSADYIDQALKNGGRVFVHCYMGYCRSPTIVLGYLMIHKGLDVREALVRIRSKRDVCPSTTFQEYLCALNEQLRKSQL